MVKPKTYITIILDQSGSMINTKAQAVQGYNEQVQQMKINAKDQDIFCSLVTFNGDVFEHLWCEPAEKLAEATAEDYLTSGSTAMRDAVGYAIEKLQRTTDPKEDIAHLVIVISDGAENSSKHYSVGALRELKDSVDRTGKWTFTYMLGCDDEYLHKIAKEMNVPISNMAKWSNARPELAVRGMKQHVNKTQNYYNNRNVGFCSQSNVYSEDPCKLADFTEESPESSIPQMIDAKVPSTPLNTLDDGHKVVCGDFVSPFKNYSPVSWTK